MYLQASKTLIPSLLNSFIHLDDDSKDGSPGKELQNWSSFIGITTAVVGNILIALALNVQRYAHIRLHRQRRERRARAKQALKNAVNGGGIYGSTGTNGSIIHNATIDRDEETAGGRESDPLAHSLRSVSSSSDGENGYNEVTSSYLRDPYWWLGQVLITVGECGNFLAYGFAPASIVSPLGVVALISNCVIAPIIFKEIFRRQDFWGVIIAVCGAVTVVLSANTKETKLEPDDVWNAITTVEFTIYVAITCTFIAVLMWASPRYGNRTILIDLGLVGLFGGYTALSTKGVSSMLSSTLLGAFTTPVTYGLLLVLLSTAVMQVRYLNRALQRFDSTQVIPIQFVLFTLSVIIGSAVLYRDFERTTAHQAIKFVGGCLLTFFGVFLITSGRPRHDDDDDEDALSEAEGINDTIGLAEQEPVPGPEVTRSQSRRSSKTSRVAFSDAISPLTKVEIPTINLPSGASPVQSPGADDHEGPPILHNPWGNSEPSHHHSIAHRILPTPAISSDTVPTIRSVAVSETSIPPPHPLPDRPETPRPPTSARPTTGHAHKFNMISPSPFSSTVSGALADRILPHLTAESPTKRKVNARRSRPSLRNSLYVPQEDLDDEEEEDFEGGWHSALEDHRNTAGHAQRGFRGRARSLSNTLGGLLGVGRRKYRTDADLTEADENDPLTRSQSHSGSGSADRGRA
ncbi:hypothetical protein DL546_004555 [Coniochaeta pulveracea]|uniref:NIPA-like protein 2 n=1 Tax=Coniochaeta pulveracea TaxID=177199 RepID=A0A420Y1S0_9PEZI|nr:hypothetical protein DL546_004555 [Coniochaeta pulveracea]